MKVDTRHYTVEVEMDEFCGALQAHELQALWKISKDLMKPVPAPKTRAWLWRWDEVYPLAQDAGRLITLERGGDRRVLAFANPGLQGAPFTSTTLWGAYQYLGPGETAPAHRHTPSAIRFILRGSGAYTTVDGDACDMEPGDLVLTPNWMWHDHNSSANEPIVWFDGLDLPLATTLDAIFFENHPLKSQPVDEHNRSERLVTALGLRELPTTAQKPARLLRYRRADVDRTLDQLHREKGGSMVSLEYFDPLTGEHVVPTFACEMHRIFPGARTSTRRKVGSTIYVVFSGRGNSIINGQRFDWSAGDTFVTPSWAAVDHEAVEPADLFSVSDRPVLQALGLYRETVVEEGQKATSVFSAESPATRAMRA